MTEDISKVIASKASQVTLRPGWHSFSASLDIESTSLYAPEGTVYVHVIVRLISGERFVCKMLYPLVLLTSGLDADDVFDVNGIEWLMRAEPEPA